MFCLLCSVCALFLTYGLERRETGHHSIVDLEVSFFVCFVQGSRDAREEAYYLAPAKPVRGYRCFFSVPLAEHFSWVNNFIFHHSLFFSLCCIFLSASIDNNSFSKPPVFIPGSGCFASYVTITVYLNSTRASQHTSRAWPPRPPFICLEIVKNPHHHTKPPISILSDTDITPPTAAVRTRGFTAGRSTRS